MQILTLDSIPLNRLHLFVISESYAETDSHTEFKKREKSDSPSDFTKSTLMDEWRQNLNYHCPTEFDEINNINNVYNVSFSNIIHSTEER